MKDSEQKVILTTPLKIELTGVQILILISSLEYARKALRDEGEKWDDGAYTQNVMTGQMLLGECRKMFNSSEHMKEICEINHIIIEACLSLYRTLEKETKL